MTLDELIYLIGENMDPDELVEVLDLSSAEIADAFDYKILSRWDKFQDIIDGN